MVHLRRLVESKVRSDNREDDAGESQGPVQRMTALSARCVGKDNAASVFRLELQGNT